MNEFLNKLHKLVNEDFSRLPCTTCVNCPLNKKMNVYPNVNKPEEYSDRTLCDVLVDLQVVLIDVGIKD